MINSVTQEQIDNIIKTSEIKTFTVFNKCTVVCVRLENGFTISESTGCVDEKNYSEDIGKEICLNKIKDKLWFLEGYLLQNKLKEDNK